MTPVERAEWGGCIGHFAGPHGHLWEVAASGVKHLFRDQ
ncbi:MAG: hypothetical protein AVDCRST_MAG10-543 [uncultured Acidimicrobiales bacterium]|uniref:Uncharacterized protein n=1 Tax=uncultured Acidimicrobiales bacterium TaxID=310071 RepID=A0A6J4HBZ8_9ACTN|nr:MAG: hypothetical protein AVDCRST_MAG10-543 [uncultured Acidimicrobiales bacterium]